MLADIPEESAEGTTGLHRQSEEAAHKQHKKKRHHKKKHRVDESRQDSWIDRARQGVHCSVFCGGRKCKFERWSGLSYEQKRNCAIEGLISNWVGPDAIASQRPSTSLFLKYLLIQQFKALNVNGVVNLQEKGEHGSCGPDGILQSTGYSYSGMDDLMSKGISYYEFPWPDMTAPEQDVVLRSVQVMDYHIKNKGKVLVHCHAGLGRTGLLIACYYVYSHHLSSNEAIKLVRDNRPGAIQTEQQFKFICAFEKHIWRLSQAFCMEISDARIDVELFVRRQRHVLHGYEADLHRFTPVFLHGILCRLINLTRRDPANACLAMQSMGCSATPDQETLTQYRRAINRRQFSVKEETNVRVLAFLLCDWFRSMSRPALSSDNCDAIIAFQRNRGIIPLTRTETEQWMEEEEEEEEEKEGEEEEEEEEDVDDDDEEDVDDEEEDVDDVEVETDRVKVRYGHLVAREVVKETMEAFQDESPNVQLVHTIMSQAVRHTLGMTISGLECLCQKAESILSTKEYAALRRSAYRCVVDSFNHVFNPIKLRYAPVERELLYDFFMDWGKCIGDMYFNLTSAPISSRTVRRVALSSERMLEATSLPPRLTVEIMGDRVHVQKLDGLTSVQCSAGAGGDTGTDAGAPYSPVSLAPCNRLPRLSTSESRKPKKKRGGAALAFAAFFLDDGEAKRRSAGEEYGRILPHRRDRLQRPRPSTAALPEVSTIGGFTRRAATMSEPAGTTTATGSRRFLPSSPDDSSSGFWSGNNSPTSLHPSSRHDLFRSPPSSAFVAGDGGGGHGPVDLWTPTPRSSRAFTPPLESAQSGPAEVAAAAPAAAEADENDERICRAASTATAAPQTRRGGASGSSSSPHRHHNIDNSHSHSHSGDKDGEKEPRRTQRQRRRGSQAAAVVTDLGSPTKRSTVTTTSQSHAPRPGSPDEPSRLPTRTSTRGGEEAVISAMKAKGVFLARASERDASTTDLTRSAPSSHASSPTMPAYAPGLAPHSPDGFALSPGSSQHSHPHSHQSLLQAGAWSRPQTPTAVLRDVPAHYWHEPHRSFSVMSASEACGGFTPSRERVEPPPVPCSSDETERFAAAAAIAAAARERFTPLTPLPRRSSTATSPTGASFRRRRQRAGSTVTATGSNTNGSGTVEENNDEEEENETPTCNTNRRRQPNTSSYSNSVTSVPGKRRVNSVIHSPVGEGKRAGRRRTHHHRRRNKRRGSSESGEIQDGSAAAGSQLQLGSASFTRGDEDYPGSSFSGGS